MLDVQLALTRESTIPAPCRPRSAAWTAARPERSPACACTRGPTCRRRIAAADRRRAAWPASAPTTCSAQLLPVGQDGSFAAGLADRFVTVGGVVPAVDAAIVDHLAAAAEHDPLAPGQGIAASLGIERPIAQGPMTRVSDRPAFAAAVADGGGLPFLALALMRGPEVRALLAEAHELLAGRPWGVGILGFVPPELRDEQLAVLRELPPPVALIAGGRPSQAAPLEAEGVATYLHVPSPGCSTASSRTAPAGSCSRAASAAATSARARASPSGSCRSSACSPSTTSATSRSSSRAASTTPARRRWSRRWRRRSPRGAGASAC